MAFADWKKRTTAFERYLPRGYHAMAELVAHAAYKAGERDGRKQAEVASEQAIKLRELMRSNVEVTGAARPYCAASVLTAGLAGNVPTKKG